MKSIIVEGYDGAGKSTLIKYLHSRLNFPVHTIGGPPRNGFIALINSAHQVIKAQTGCYIFDRCTPISRLCYESDISLMHAELLDAALNMLVRRCVFVHCRPTEYNHEVKSHDTQEHLDKIKKHKYFILSKYDGLLSSIPHLEYNYQRDDQEQLFQEIVQCL